MDLTFICPACKQQLEADTAMSGSEIQCPTCNNKLVIPEADAANVRTHNPIASSASAKQEYHFSVPVHDEPVESLIVKPKPPLEAAARGEEKQLRIRCIRRTDCVEVGKDHFEEVVNDFLNKIGETNLVSINTLNYTHIDMGTRQILTDYGVMIVYKG